MNIGAFLDKLIWFGAGIYFIFLSVKKKEKLGSKAALIRFCGIILIVLGVILSFLSIFK
ncbi:MAG: hypothetical protein ABIH40_02910 [Candidatus Omnitrophota bacterium]